MIALLRTIGTQILLHLTTNKKLQEYTALKAIEVLKTLAEKTNNKFDDKLVEELRELLKSLGIIK